DSPLVLNRGPYSLANPLRPQPVVRILGYLLDSTLSWKKHIAFWANRASTTAIATRMLGSSLRGLSPLQRRRLYVSCVLPVLTYGCQ
ncbi:hypothetical protein BD309DRAFT_840480, partial [Dichomitus squalens]